MLEPQILPPAPIPLRCGKAMVSGGQVTGIHSPVTPNDNVFDIEGEIMDEMALQQPQYQTKLHNSLDSLREENIAPSYNSSPVEDTVGENNDELDSEYVEEKPISTSPSNQWRNDIESRNHFQCANTEEHVTVDNGEKSKNFPDTSNQIITDGRNKSSSKHYTDPSSPTTVTHRISNRNGGGKPCAKKSFVWKYFNHPMNAEGLIDRGRTQCILCNSQLAFNASGTTTTMLNHLKSRHGDIAEHEEAQRRYSRPHKAINRNSLQNDLQSIADKHFGSTEEQFDLSMDPKSQMTGELNSSRSMFNNNRMSRNSSSVGQRGRPPGSGRRTRVGKGSAEACLTPDYLEQVEHAQNSGSMKADNSSNVFPLNYCTNLTEQQQYALLTEMIRSAEAASKENSSFSNVSNAFLSNLSAAEHPLFPPQLSHIEHHAASIGLPTVFASNICSRTEQEEKGAMPNLAKTLTTTSGTLDNNRNPLLPPPPPPLPPCGLNLPNWSSAANDLQLSMLSMTSGQGSRLAQDLSSSSASSGLGTGSASTVSPLATSTLTVSPPSSSSSGGQNITSPTGHQLTTHWAVKHQQYQQQSQPVDGYRRENGVSEVSTPVGVTGSTGASPCRPSSPSPMVLNAAQAKSNSLLTGSTEATNRLNVLPNVLGRPEYFTGDHSLSLASIGIDGAQSQALNSHAIQSNTPSSDLTSTFTKFMNLMPSINGTDCSAPCSTSPTSTSPPTTITTANYIQQMADSLRVMPHQQHHHQHQQQQLMAANAWLSSLASGFPSSALMNQSTVLSLLTGGMVNGDLSPTNLRKTNTGVIKANNNNYPPPIGFPTPSLNANSTVPITVGNPTPAPHLGGLNMLSSIQDPMEAASNHLMKCAISGLTSVGTGAWQTSLSLASACNTVAGRLPNSPQYSLQQPLKTDWFSDATPVSSFHATSLCESLDLSKQMTPINSSTSPAKFNSVSPAATSNNNGQFENGMLTPASTKRKRARPVYISPDQILSSPTGMESTFCWEGEHPDDRPTIKAKKSLFGSVDNHSSQTEATPQRQMTHRQLLYQLARFLVKDMQPPEFLERKGFLELMSAMTKHVLPSASVMRNEFLPKLMKQVRDEIPGLLSEQHADVSRNEFSKTSAQLPAASVLPPSVTVAFSVELFPVENNRPALVDDLCEYDSNGCHGNIEVHYCCPPHYRLTSRFYESVKVTPQVDLPSLLTRCRSLFSTDASASTSGTSEPTVTLPNWPCPLVTNAPGTLSELLQLSQESKQSTNYPFTTPTSTTNFDSVDAETIKPVLTEINNSGDTVSDVDQQFIVIPCLVSQLARAVMAGLNLPEVQEILIHCRQAHPKQSNHQSKPDLTKNEEEMHYGSSLLPTEEESCEHQNHPATDCEEVLPQTWSGIETLLKHAINSGLCNHQQATACPSIVNQLLTVLETMNETLELIHRDDLVLTTSMIEPILQNLRQTRIAPVNDKVSLDTVSPVVESVKAAILEHLNKTYPETGKLRESLQLASLLDPRFKDHVSEQNPTTVKLLKSKLEFIPETTDSREHCDNKMSTEGSAGRAGLKGVFGLQSFPRVSLSEADRYLREEPVGLETDPLSWWAERAANYPRLARLATYYMTIPLTCFSKGRLKPTRPTGVPTAAMKDGLGLPSIFDSLGLFRRRIAPDDQRIYNFLWHNWDLTTNA